MRYIVAPFLYMFHYVFHVSLYRFDSKFCYRIIMLRFQILGSPNMVPRVIRLMCQQECWEHMGIWLPSPEYIMTGRFILVPGIFNQAIYWLFSSILPLFFFPKQFMHKNCYAITIEVIPSTWRSKVMSIVSALCYLKWWQVGDQSTEINHMGSRTWWNGHASI